MESSGSVHSRMINRCTIITSAWPTGTLGVSEWYRMTVDALKDCNKKHLAKLAKDRGIAGWHAMRKDQLIRALSVPRSSATAAKSRSKSKSRVSSRRDGTPVRTSSTSDGPARSSSPNGKCHPATIATAHPIMSLPTPTLDHAHQKDRIVVLTRDSYWLHAYWELSRTTLARAQAALGQEWHTARPILRLMDVSSEDTTSASERHVRDIPIHGGVNNWYIDVVEPSRSYRIDVGYLSRRGTF